MSTEYEYISSGALMCCDKGSLPCALTIAPRFPTIGGKPWANTSDKDPVLNKLNFGVCSLTQKPCPATCQPTQWLDAHKTLEVAGRPALLEYSSLPCALGGCITFVHSGQLR